MIAEPTKHHLALYGLALALLFLPACRDREQPAEEPTQPPPVNGEFEEAKERVTESIGQAREYVSEKREEFTAIAEEQLDAFRDRIDYWQQEHGGEDWQDTREQLQEKYEQARQAYRSLLSATQDNWQQARDDFTRSLEELRQTWRQAQEPQPPEQQPQTDQPPPAEEPETDSPTQPPPIRPGFENPAGQSE